MDFFYRNLEAAQEQARSLSITASNSAKGFAEQLTEHTKSLAGQAAEVSSAAAEHASQRWKDINIQDTLRLKSLQAGAQTEKGPSLEELERYGITPDFKDFIRSLTYSTFRDFPLDQLPEIKEDGEKTLTPWQEKHALLVVQEVKEIDELRFVLCPKRMTDAQFWVVYYSLARRYMPAEAFDPGFSEAPASPEVDQVQKRFLDLQRGIRKGFQTAREWGSRAGGSLQPAETSAQLSDLVEAHSRGGTPRASISREAGAEPLPTAPGSHGEADSLRQGSAAPSEADLDTDLEAYLQTIEQDPEERAGGSAASQAGEDSESAADLDEYLNEISGDHHGSGSDSGDGVDVSEYMEDMKQSEDSGPHAGSQG